MAEAPCGGGDGGGHEEPASSSAPGEPPESATDTIDEAPQLKGEELAAALNDSNVFLLDVRNPEELEELGTVEGYTNIPIDQLAGRLDEGPWALQSSWAGGSSPCR